MSGRDLHSFVTSHRIADTGISSWSKMVIICHLVQFIMQDFYSPVYIYIIYKLQYVNL